MSAAITEYTRMLDAQVEAYERAADLEHAAAVNAGEIDPRNGKRSLLTGAKTASELDAMVLPPTEYAIPGLIPEGASMIVSAPKVGKSWMVLGIAQAIATGGSVFGSIPVAKRPVLYLALEDGWKRLQKRRRKVGGIAPPGLTFLPTLEGDAGETIAEFLHVHAGETPVVIVDTLQKIRGVSNGADKYAQDYKAIGDLKDLVDAHPGSSLILVHHTRKSEGGDFLDSVSGTQGIAGALDAILALRRVRGSNEGTLFVTARDAAEGEYAMHWDDGTWTLDGGSLEAAAERAQMTERTGGLGDLSQQVLQAVLDSPAGISPATIVKVVNGLDAKTASQYLGRLVKSQKIIKSGRGVYLPIPVGDPLRIIDQD